MPDPEGHSGALEAVDRILERGGDADSVLRDVVAVLHDHAGFDWAGIAFVESERLQVGPSAGTYTGKAESVTVTYDGRLVVLRAAADSQPTGDTHVGRKDLHVARVDVTANADVAAVGPGNSGLAARGDRGVRGRRPRVVATARHTPFE